MLDSFIGSCAGLLVLLLLASLYRVVNGWFVRWQVGLPYRLGRLWRRIKGG